MIWPPQVPLFLLVIAGRRPSGRPANIRTVPPTAGAPPRLCTGHAGLAC